MFGYGGAGASFVTMILTIVAIAVPVFWYSEEKTIATTTLEMGLGYSKTWQKMTMNGVTTETDTNNLDCDSGKGTDNQQKCCDGVKAGFAFMFMALVINLVQLVAFLNSAMKFVALPAFTPMAVTALLLVFHIIGWLTPMVCNDYIDDVNKNMFIDLKLSLSFILAVLSWIISLCTVGCGFMIMNAGPEEQPADGHGVPAPGAVTVETEKVAMDNEAAAPAADAPTASV